MHNVDRGVLQAMWEKNLRAKLDTVVNSYLLTRGLSM